MSCSITKLQKYKLREVGIVFLLGARGVVLCSNHVCMQLTKFEGEVHFSCSIQNEETINVH